MKNSILKRACERGGCFLLGLRDIVRERVRNVWAFLRPRVLRSGRLAVIAGAAAFVVLLLHRELYSVVSRSGKFAIDPGTSSQTAAHSRADGTGVEERPGSVAPGVGASTLDDETVGRVAAALRANPWIRRVEKVERVYPDKIRVRYEFREPLLAVQTPHGYVFLDQEQIRLPGVYASPARADQIVVKGVRSPAPAEGTEWVDPFIRASLELADLYRRDPLLGALGIRMIDASNPVGTLVLQTAGGCSIHWGRAAAMAGSREIPERKKLDNLKRVLAYYPKLDGLEAVRVYVEEAPTVTLRDRNNARRR